CSLLRINRGTVLQSLTSFAYSSKIGTNSFPNLPSGDWVARVKQQGECFAATGGIFFCFSVVAIVPLAASILSSLILLHISAHMTLKNRAHEGKNEGLGARWELAKDEPATHDQQDWQKEGVPGPGVGLSLLLRSLDKSVRARGG
uniref:Uncharacterized protein n=1 Tax=Brassica oleracea var. oleracea TaxID=109376 RepID=A0A0D3DLJ5_BRAOL